MDPSEPDSGNVQGATGRLAGGAVGDAKAEFAVHATGDDSLVGMWFHPRGQPQEDIRPAPGLPGQRLEKLEVMEIVRNDPADSHVQRSAQFLRGLVAAVQHQRGGRYPGAQRGVDLSRRDDIDPQAFFMRQAAGGHAAQGFAGKDRLRVRIMLL